MSSTSVTTPISRPVEIPEIRRMIRHPDAGRYPQIALRVGYGKATGAIPRRPVAEVLMPARNGLPVEDH